ncbi:50S ribosomal protein L17 [Candidatus Parcubacteria bacterium]|nr:MAG: 50S ribosomal protein L17 [Candidatus Parcubacteria bacterium]
MKHLRKGKKLSRKKDQRNALKKALVTALFLRGRITTTLTKAKATTPIAEKFITKAKSPDLAVRRNILQGLSPRVTSKLIKDIAPRYSSRSGGYTRIIRIGVRKSDAAPMVILELI